MANTYSPVYCHIIFSTKNRVKSVHPESVWAYIGGIARKHCVTALQGGGVEDHIHARVIAPPTLAPGTNAVSNVPNAASGRADGPSSAPPSMRSIDPTFCQMI